MHICEMDQTKFPCYVIDNFVERTQTWQRFTVEPFSSEAEAESHKQLIMDEYKVDPRNLRVRLYTEDEWRADLIDAILKDEGALRRALSVLRSSVLAYVLH